jgi:hypothetical protein
MEYINFESKNHRFAGDGNTWARKSDNGEITLQIANKGLMSEGFAEELTAFIYSHILVSGKPFTSYGTLKCGERVVLK